MNDDPHIPREIFSQLTGFLEKRREGILPLALCQAALVQGPRLPWENLAQGGQRHLADQAGELLLSPLLMTGVIVIRVLER